MNFIAIIILITLILDFFINLIADTLNLKALKTELPESFVGFYNSKKYKQSQEYLRVNTKFGWLSSSFGLIVILILWFGKFFPTLDKFVLSFNFNPIISGLIYIGILLLAKSILSIPFSLYSTFVIEAKFGFNKTSYSTYFLDLIKGFFLSLILGGLLLGLILIFFEYAGEKAWLYCWIGVTIFMIIIQYLFPTWIMPLFNKFTPLEEGELKTAIFNYAQSIDFPLKNIFVMDGSKRSTKSNAFFTGFGQNKRIILFDTLIKNHSVTELVAILAHEMGHYKKKHILQTMIVGIFQVGLILFLLSLFLTEKSLFNAFYVEKPSIYAGLIFFSFLFSPMEFFINILFNIWSRRNEYEADKFALETTLDKNGLSRSLKKLATHNLSNLTPHPFYVFLKYSHPPILKRLKKLEP